MLMIYDDDVYGSILIEEKVLIDLMQTKAMERLKGVNQGGPFILMNPRHEWRNFKITRFEHSVGVCLLLKIFNTSLEEQVAGLLHDVSHTVFSHALDFLFNRNVEHDYHESLHKKMILDSSIPSILEKHGLNVEDIIDKKRFTILERELPDLCADRIDYSLRFMLECGMVSKNQVNDILNALTIHDDEIVFDDETKARFFAQKYIEANKLSWCNPLQASLFHVTSETVKIAISKGILTNDDLFTTDEEVINKLKNSQDERIIEMLDLIRNIDVVEDKSNYDYHLKSKVRCTDPKVLIGDGMMRLSEIDKDYKELMNDFVSEASKGFFVRIIRKS